MMRLDVSTSVPFWTRLVFFFFSCLLFLYITSLPIYFTPFVGIVGKGSVSCCALLSRSLTKAITAY